MKRMPIRALAAMAGLALATPTHAQDYAFLSANLFSDYVPGGGVENAGADFNAEVDFEESRLCYYLDITGLSGADVVNIYHGKEQETGPAVVKLALPQNGDEVCVAAEKAVLQEIVAQPDDYYIAVCTPRHPEGAIRGQLEG